MSATSPPLDVESIRAPMHAVHVSKANLSYAWRRKQLLQLQKMVQNHREEIAVALFKDLGKCRMEAIGTEIIMFEGDLDYILRNVEDWMKPEEVPSPGLAMPVFSRIVSVPKTPPGCLVIGPSNYPCLLTLKPAAGALAAGNPVVIKPSELAPATAVLLKKLCDQYFDKGALKVVLGGVEETTQLLEQPWGLVFFIGSERVGKIVAAAAAKTLTPTILELGGKCPCYVDETIPGDVTQVANRITWAKTVNAGQTCVGIDTLIVHESVLDTLLPKMVCSLEIQFPPPAIESELGRFRHRRHAQRLIDLIKEVETAAKDEKNKTRIVCGGSKACNLDEGYIEPTIVLNPPRGSAVLREEIFGPILPVVTVKSRQEAIQFIRNSLPGTPLSLYVFTKDASVFEEVREACPAGSCMRNDALVHFASPFIPFGGLGTSGYGAYFGRHSFDAFSHKQPIMYRPCGPGLDFYRVRYHPLGDTGVKPWLLMNFLSHFPNVPVLHLMRWFLVTIVLLPLIWTEMPIVVGLRIESRSQLAQVLHYLAACLEESKNNI